MGRRKLDLGEEIDFAYLLELLMPLYNVPEYAWLPELFSIIGHESLLKLCKYAGGETIRIPTLSQLHDAMCALQLFYELDIAHKSKSKITGVSNNILELLEKVRCCYAEYNSEDDTK